jgi:signal peptidase I
MKSSKLFLGIIILFAYSAFTYSNDCNTVAKKKIIRGNSLAGLFENNQSVTALYNHYACHPVERGDVVLIRKSYRKSEVIKQILVVPGDQFEMRPEGESFTLYVNGVAPQTTRGERYIYSSRFAKMLRLYEKNYQGKLPEDVYLAFGTNSYDSFDSSRWGPLPKEEIVAKVIPTE